MAHTKSAKKRARTSGEQNVKNTATKSLIKSVRRKFLEAVTQKEVQAARGAFSLFCRTLDKAAKQGVIKRNTAIRRKTRAAASLRAIVAKS